jgi:hypothetical protein
LPILRKEKIKPRREGNMAQKLDPEQMVDLKELVLSEVIQMEALVMLLESKGILTRQELLERMENIASQMRKVET